MNKYLTIKLGEEGAEVAKEAFKVQLHGDRRARKALMAEMADMKAIISLARRRMSEREMIEFDRMVSERIEREEKKGLA